MQAWLEAIKQGYLGEVSGRVRKSQGGMLTAELPYAKIGSVVQVESTENSEPVLAEVVSFTDHEAWLMPLSQVAGIRPGSTVKPLWDRPWIQVTDNMLGHVLDGFGNSMDGPIEQVRPVRYDLRGVSASPLSRPIISSPLDLGVRSINGCLTVGVGQRMGIFSGSGVGKSTLLGMVARYTSADVNVIVLVGERGRELREFLDRDLGEEGKKRSVVIVATSDKSAIERLRSVWTGLTIAEHFRDQGKQVLFMMDSLTRFAMARREIAVGIGEPVTTKGYTTSCFSEMPKIIERCGNFETGSITGIFTVLVEGDDMEDPVADTARSLLDGHIVLNRKLAERGWYPPVDVNASISRVMNSVVTDEHKAMSQKVRRWLALLQENDDLIKLGAYKQGTDRELDDAISHRSAIESFLTQSVSDRSNFEDTLGLIRKLVR